MKLVTKDQFLEMFEIGILIGSERHAKTWTTCSKNKGSKRKNRYVDDESYAEYMRVKNNK